MILDTMCAENGMVSTTRNGRHALGNNEYSLAGRIRERCVASPNSIHPTSLRLPLWKVLRVDRVENRGIYQDEWCILNMVDIRRVQRVAIGQRRSRATAGWSS